jgi:hypothetical protein
MSISDIAVRMVFWTMLAGLTLIVVTSPAEIRHGVINGYLFCVGVIALAFFFARAALTPSHHPLP